MKPLKYVLVWYMHIMMLYDVIMWHRLYDTWRVYDASSEWRRMMRTPRMNPYAACMYVVCMCFNDTVMIFLSVWCACRMRRESLYECFMTHYDVNMNVWRFREEMTEFREEMIPIPRYDSNDTCNFPAVSPATTGHRASPWGLGGSPTPKWRISRLAITRKLP